MLTLARNIIIKTEESANSIQLHLYYLSYTIYIEYLEYLFY